MSLENIMISEINQTKRTNIVWFHSHEKSRIYTFIKTENRLELAMRDVGVGSYHLVVTEFLFGMMKSFGHSCTTL